MDALTPRRPALPELVPGTVWLVGAGPGDPGLLTLLALHAIEQAEVILHDSLVSDEILALAGPAARLEAVGKRSGRPGARQLCINQRLIELARAGRRVVRLKGGDPLVFGRGGEEALALAAAAVPFRIVPGVTAGLGALAYAGIPATHRGLARSVAFVTGHTTGGGEPIDWPALAAGAETLVLFMALHRLPAIAAALLAAGRDPAEPLAIIADGTSPWQQTTRTTLAGVTAIAATVDRSRPTLIVVGKVVGLADLLAPWLQSQASSTPTRPVRRLAASQR